MRILVIGGLSSKGMKFIFGLEKGDWLVIWDNFKRKETGKNLMKLLVTRKFKIYQGNEKNMEKINEITKLERIEKIYDFST